MFRLPLLPCAAVLLSLAGVTAQERGSELEEQVAVLLQSRCLDCHDAESAKGDWNLQAERPFQDVVVPGDAEASLLFEMVRGEEPEMPLRGEPLQAQEQELVRQWIEEGAPWSGIRLEKELWWSLQSLGEVVPPAITDPWIRNDIDKFILRGLRSQGLQASPAADRATLLRRLSFDLTGLPPTQEEIRSFLGDSSPDSYERQVDRLLDSPRYGERWARHWLDVVHYADTHGYDKDKPRPHAWPYRDYVIQALNQDKPYARFVKEQIAGDVLYPGDPNALVATGMIAAGPWDFVGHVELREGTVDKKKTRNLDRDDMVANVMGSFQSLTATCARCHDHKFDPITQEDYYRLQAVFAGVERADRSYEADPATAQRRATLAQELALCESQLEQLEDHILQRMEGAVGEETFSMRRQREELESSLPAADRSQALGYHSQIEPAGRRSKWVQVDLGEEMPLQRVVLFPCDEAFGEHPGPGFGWPPRMEIQFSSTGDFSGEHRNVARLPDETPLHGNAPWTVELESPQIARFVRVQVSRLWERTDDFCFALAELQAWSDDVNVALQATVEAQDSIEAGDRWGKRFLVDGTAPWTPDHERWLHLEADWQSLRQHHTTPEDVAVRAELQSKAARLEDDLADLAPLSKVYTITSDFAREGNFTPPPEIRPRDIHVLHRGDVEQRGPMVSAGAVAAVTHAPCEFQIPEGEGEGARRAALAEWIVDPENPLTWRSIVNRVWHYHFGRGLVGTPNDFGRMGEKPSHPELLDWLARRFRDGGGSLKALHRELVLSATYRQSSQHWEPQQSMDAGNRWLWRAPRRRLESEALRDAVLWASGDLNLEMGGPGFQLFAYEDDHSPRYLYNQVPLEDAGIRRRSIYRFIVRSVPDPWMTSFDCADPSACTAVRFETTTPAQSLALLNDTFILWQAERFAGDLEQSEATLVAQVTEAVWRTWQRAPSASELRELLQHAEALRLTCTLSRPPQHQ